jgi:two-component system nitrogen regulation sensor histidine kinase NtrY
MTLDTPTVLNPGLNRRAFEFSRLVRTLGYVAVVMAMAVAVATFFILMGLTPIAPTEAVILTVLVLNGALAVILILVISWEIGSLVLARQRGRAAARLHIRIVGLFSIVAATPAIVVAVVASVTLDRGLDNWFSTNTRAIVENSANIATAFVDSQAQSLDTEITGLQRELERGRALLVVLLSAVYLGLSFANRLVQPIRRLIGAADQVAAGDLNVEVHIRKSEGDLANLGDTFNKMTAQLRDQREDLISARDQIDSRRRFTEAVLAGVTAGVIGLDEDGHVTLLNRFAVDILGVSEPDLMNSLLAEKVPEFAALIARAERGAPIVQGQVTLLRAGRERTLVVRVALEADEAGSHGAVVTIDDVTDLVVAQRTSAWADIARRIAHEIKNPLTPIQLSAERLKRRYGRVITEDREVFDQCTDTIIRQVGDIGRMVDEFSSFARMPKPVFEMEDVADTVRQIIFMMRIGYPEIDIEADVPEGAWNASFDRRLISQALTNIIKNATEAIGAVPDETRGKGRILVRLTTALPFFVVDVVDNGIGLPKENRHRLLEPYVTTREKGTGLGLAIVGKILEEHGGSLGLYDAPADAEGHQRGAHFRLTFKDQKLAAAPAAAAE